MVTVKSKVTFLSLLKNLTGMMHHLIGQQFKCQKYFLMLKKFPRTDAPFVGAVPFISHKEKLLIGEISSNKNGFLLPTKCLEGVLKYSLLILSFNYFKFSIDVCRFLKGQFTHQTYWLNR